MEQLSLRLRCQVNSCLKRAGSTFEDAEADTADWKIMTHISTRVSLSLIQVREKKIRTVRSDCCTE